MLTAPLRLGRRIACAVTVYLIYAIAATLLVPKIVTFTQLHGITTFYELAPDESPGPLGDLYRALFEVGSEYALFILTMTPVFWWLRGPWWLYVSLLLLNEPLLFAALLSYFRLTGR